jgi:RNA polymerase sigma-70 factor (ECF subfamily)
MSTTDPPVSLRIEQARRNEPGALGGLLEGYRNYLRLLARTGLSAALKRREDPSDVAQGALLKACQHFDQFRGATEEELTGWLRSILGRHLKDLTRRYRAQRREAAREQSLDGILTQSGHGLGALLAARGNSPSQSVERRDLGVLLSDALAELREASREVIILHNLEELDWKQVAARMGRTVGAVRMLWARALKELQPILAAHL